MCRLCTSRPITCSTAPSKKPYVEDDPTAPISVYGASKLAGEEEVRRRHKKHVILRTSWVYGQYGSNFLKTMLRLAEERSELRVVADQRGSPTCTADLAQAVFALAPRLTRADEPSVGTYHFTGEGATNWCRIRGRDSDSPGQVEERRPKLTPITTAEYPTPARRPMNSVLDNSRFRSTFGLSAKSWRQSVKESVDALLASARGVKGHHPGRRRRHAALSDHDQCSPSSCCRSTTSR